MSLDDLTVPVVLVLGAVSSAGAMSWWLGAQLRAVSTKIDDLRLHIVSSYVTHERHNALESRVSDINDRVVRLEARQ